MGLHYQIAGSFKPDVHFDLRCEKDDHSLQINPKLALSASQFSRNLHDNGNNFLVVFHFFENSGPSREVFVVSFSVTTSA